MYLYNGQEQCQSVLEKSEIKVGMHQGAVLSPFLSAFVGDVITEFENGCVN